MPRSFAAVFLLAASALAQAPVTLTIDPRASGPAIPPDFLGLSFESSNLLPEPTGAHLFSASNRPLIALFRTLGIRSLRLGGATADMPRYAIPGPADIDNLFAFAEAADLHVLYTLRLPRTAPEKDAAIARYIERHYAARLTCFEIGNEPDYYRRVYPEFPEYSAYRAAWKKIAAAVTAGTPAAKFCGPAAGGITGWSRNFAADFAATGQIAALVQHQYPGGNGALAGGASARDAMLSRDWLELYDRLYQSFARDAIAHRLPFRLEETNNYTGGAKDATDTFAAALWALDYLHWWAAHGAAGINFHNRRWILNDTIVPIDPSGDGLTSGYRVRPIAYGIQAFDLGGHGAVVPVAIGNPQALNLTAYAVRAPGRLYVTIINKKDPRTPPRDALVTIAAPATRPGATAMFLTAESASLQGHWSPAGLPILVPGASAAIISLPLP